MTDLSHDPHLVRLQRRTLVAASAGVLVCVVSAVLSPEAFLQGYLAGFLFWLGIPLGCLVIVMLHYLAGGAWGVVVRRVAEAAATTVPLFALLFIPIALGVRPLFRWAQPDVVAMDPALQGKAAYLNVPFFLARAVVYFVAWAAVAFVLDRWSRRRDVEPDTDPRRFRLFAGPGLVVYGLTVTFAAIDWGMSLEPHWYSTVYPVMIGVGQVLSAFAFTIAVVVLLRDREPFGRLVNGPNLIDLGNLLLVFVLLWAYLSFAQFMLIWSGNIREEVTWYVLREQPLWLGVALVLIALHFALPFALLLQRSIKRNPTALAAVAVLVLVMRLVDNWWLVLPPTAHDGGFHWPHVVVPLAIGTVWVAAFVWQLRGHPLVPANDPLVEQAMGAHGH